jgi:hypothetical protein
MTYMRFKLPFMRRLLLPLILLAGSACAAGPIQQAPAMTNASTGFTVVELRRYTLKDGGREAFVRYFDTLFPEAFQQLGAIALGQFTEPHDANKFTWMRAFRSMDARAIANAGFYYGPVWKEHREKLNGLMVDSDDVLLLRPLGPGHGVTLLGAVDPVREPGGAQGAVVAQIFALGKADADAFAQSAGPVFARYRAAGAREAGLLATLDAPNNFPQLPVRTDGHYLVWLGLFENLQSAERFRALAGQAAAELAQSGQLREPPTLLVLQPTSRSRLRWLAQ